MNMTRDKVDKVKRSRKRGEGQDGSVLFVVLLLIIMFTGLGLLAMRHTRQELRSSGAYKDNSQATALAEGALAMLATDLKKSADYYGANFALTDYQTFHGDGGTNSEDEYHIPPNPELFPEIAGGFCESNPGVEGCVHQLSWASDHSGVDLDDDDGLDTWDDGTNELIHYYNERAVTTVKQFAPIVGPCPPGYSCNDEQNYGWYIFKVEANVKYGGSSTDPSVYERGHAVGKGRMTIGPVGVYGK